MDDLIIDPATELNRFQDQFSAFLLHRGHFDGEEAGLRVYRNNVMLSLTRALADQYPAVKNLVGEQFFNALSRDYVLAHPPEDPALTLYGADMAEFIAGHGACERLPWLADVARLEFNCQVALHAADEPVLDIQCLAAAGGDQLDDLRLQLRQSVKLMKSRFPVEQIRREALSDNPRRVAMDESEIHCLLIHREDLSVSVNALSEVQWTFLQQLAEGKTLIQAWEYLQGVFALADDSLTPLLSQILSQGIFTDARTES